MVAQYPAFSSAPATPQQFQSGGGAAVPRLGAGGSPFSQGMNAVANALTGNRGQSQPYRGASPNYYAQPPTNPSPMMGRSNLSASNYPVAPGIGGLAGVAPTPAPAPVLSGSLAYAPRVGGGLPARVPVPVPRPISPAAGAAYPPPNIMPGNAPGSAYPPPNVLPAGPPPGPGGAAALMGGPGFLPTQNPGNAAALMGGVPSPVVAPPGPGGAAALMGGPPVNPYGALGSIFGLSS